MTTFYKGKHIVKYCQNGKFTAETYVEFDDGQIYICTYINGKCCSKVNVATLKGD